LGDLFRPINLLILNPTIKIEFKIGIFILTQEKHLGHLLFFNPISINFFEALNMFHFSTPKRNKGIGLIMIIKGSQIVISGHNKNSDMQYY